MHVVSFELNSNVFEVLIFWMGDPDIPPIIFVISVFSILLTSVLPMLIVDEYWIALAMPFGLGKLKFQTGQTCKNFL